MSQPAAAPRPTVLASQEYATHPRLRNLIGNFRIVVAIPMLQELSFDQVVDLFWYAQLLKAEEVERRQAQAARALALMDARAKEGQP